MRNQNLRRNCSLYRVTASASAAETPSPGLFSSLTDESLRLSVFCNTLDLHEWEPLQQLWGGGNQNGKKSPSDSSRRGLRVGAEQQAPGRRLSRRKKQAGGSSGGRRALPLLLGPESPPSLPRHVLVLGLCIGEGGTQASPEEGPSKERQ